MQLADDTSIAQSLILNEDVHFCVTEGQGVFLDLKRDSYSAIPILSDLVGPGDDVPASAVLKAFERHRAELLEEGLVTESDTLGGDVDAYRSIARPVSHIFDPDDDRAFGLTGKAGGEAVTRARDLFDFTLASRRASRDLKRRHIRDIVGEVRARKAQAGGGTNDLNQLRQQTAIYRKLRPWYPRGYLCIYDGLALIEFLARRKLFPAWIFGVQAQPFGAHCWVQQGDVLLNEATEYAGQFTPIMSV